MAIHKFLNSSTVAVTLGAAVFGWGKCRASIIIDFEDRADMETVTMQYNGLGASFTNAQALTAGLSLNEFEFPPHSGTNVVANTAATLRVDSVGLEWSSVGGYLTGSSIVTFTAFAADNSVLGTASTAGPNTSSGSFPPNEFLSLSFPNIDYVTFSGPSDFSLDDFTFQQAAPPGAVPEWTSIASWTPMLMVLSLAALRVRSARAPREMAAGV
jgi:hypothetical protein